MRPRGWKVIPLQMNKIWYKRQIFRLIFQLIFTVKKTINTLNLPWNLWLFTPTSSVSIKKCLLSNINSRIVEFPKVNKTIIKQNKDWTQTNYQYKRQNPTLPLQWRTKFWTTIHILQTNINCLLVLLMLS